MDADAQRCVALDGPLHLGRTLGPLRRGLSDPTIRLEAHQCWRATLTPEGPATLHLTVEDVRLSGQAWGPGAEWAIEQMPQLAGLDDASALAFSPFHPLIRALHRRFPGVRIGRTRAVAQAVFPSVLEQKVIGAEAHYAYRFLVRRLGQPAPGPCSGQLMIPPTPAALAATPSWIYHRAGVERRRADTLTRAMARANRLEETATMALPDAYRRLKAFPGIGAWTAAEVAAVALGDADAVPVGDFHVPHQVSWALAGEARGSDERMLELLAAFSPHRGRVLRLLALSGITAPRFGPRLAPQRIASY